MKTKAAASPRENRNTAYVAKARAKQAVISIVRGLLLFGLCFMIIEPMLTRLGVSLMK